MSRDSRVDRARNRRNWPVVKLSLAEDGVVDLSMSTTVEERLAMMWRLAVDAWASLGEPIPEYERASAPGRVVRPGDEA